jgi:hypothetical protein
MMRPFRHPVNAADLPHRHRSPENPFTVKAKASAAKNGIISIDGSQGAQFAG